MAIQYRLDKIESSEIGDNYITAFVTVYISDKEIPYHTPLNGLNKTPAQLKTMLDAQIQTFADAEGITQAQILSLTPFIGQTFTVGG